jgi:hypothetical protein
MKRILFLSGITLFGLAAFGMSTNARAQSLPVDVDIIVEPGGVTILNYFEALDVSVNPADLAAVQNSGYCPGTVPCPNGPSLPLDTSVGPGLAGGELTGDGGLTLPAATGNLAKVKVDVDAVWAVRAIGGTGVSTQVTINKGTALTLTDASGSTIAINDVKGYLMGGGGANNVLTFPDPGLAIPTFGGVQLDLDLTNALSAGTYSSTATPDADANYTIEITGT